MTTKAELIPPNIMAKVQVLRPFTPSNSQGVTVQPSSENTLYEPFNSRSSWAGIGNSLNNWSDSTLDTEKVQILLVLNLFQTDSKETSPNFDSNVKGI